MVHGRNSLTGGLFCATVLVVIACSASAATEDSIDTALDSCLATDKGQTDAGMITCTSIAIEAWNAKLNRIYQKEIAALDPRSRDLLHTSEDQWVAFRAAEHAAQAGPWRDDRGTGINIQVMGDDLSAIKERIAELKPICRQIKLTCSQRLLPCNRGQIARRVRRAFLVA